MTNQIFKPMDKVTHIQKNINLYVLAVINEHPIEKIPGKWVKCRFLVEDQHQSDWFLDFELKHFEEKEHISAEKLSKILH